MAPVLLLLILAAVLDVQAQQPSVPPLQWINLSPLLQGTAAPPPLRDAAIGYDEDSRTLVIFGGQAQSGLVQSQTYLLNLDTLTWSIPSPPLTLAGSPPSRSAATYGIDFAASNRHGFVVIGGRGADGKPLSDIWEFDFINQFWARVQVSPGGPTPRWGASGGVDIRTPFVQDPVVQGPNNTFYLAGGFDGTNPQPLSEVWRLSVAGALSSNLPNSVVASWSSETVGQLPSRIDQAGTIIAQTIIAAGGCPAGSNLTNSSCAVQDAFIINTSNDQNILPTPCPAPRLGPLLLPNLNTFSPSFASQAFFLLGTFNTTQWDDDNGLTKGEVAILDTNTGAWARVLPSGDPSSQTPFPSPRQGAVGVASPISLVGSNRNVSSDLLVFGGQDANGNTLSELWLLRAYNGFLSPGTTTWPGFGNGQLQSGVNADGSGVSVSYIQDCASAVSSPGGGGKGGGGGGSNNGGNGSNNGNNQQTSKESQFDTAKAHKILSPIALLAALIPLLYLSLRSPHSSQESAGPKNSRIPPVICGSIAATSYGLGVAGLIIAFTTIVPTASNSNPSPLHLRTAHGIVGLAFGACLYALVPIIFIASKVASRPRGIHWGSRFRRRRGSKAGSGSATSVDGDIDIDNDNDNEADNDNEDDERPQTPLPLRSSVPHLPTLPHVGGTSPGEKHDIFGRSASPSSPPSVHDNSPPASPRQRTVSWDAYNVNINTNGNGSGNGNGAAVQRPGTAATNATTASGSEANLSEASNMMKKTSTPPVSSPKKGGFEVLNRPKGRRPSDALSGSQAGSQAGTGVGQRSLPTTRALSEIDWLLRRRSLGAVGELDYVLTQAHNAQVMAMGSYPATPHALSDTNNPTGRPFSYPKTHVLLAHALLHISIIGLSAVSLAMLWTRPGTPKYLFAILLVVLLLFYAVLIGVGWKLSKTRPGDSVVGMVIWRMRGGSASKGSLGGHIGMSESSAPLTGPNAMMMVESPLPSSTPYGPGTPMSSGPYMHTHRPLVRPGTGHGTPNDQLSRPLSVATDDADDDIDEDTRQRLIEEEMERRDVSIITVPRRKLKIANPE